MCNECGGTGMWDVLSSIPCKCMSKKVNLAALINRYVRFKEKAIKECRWQDAAELKDIETKLIKKIKNG